MDRPPRAAASRSGIGSLWSDHRLAVVGAVTFIWLRVMVILSTRAFETPDTASYRSGQGTRPPVSSALLSILGDTPFVLLSALVSTAGFVAIAWALWNPQRRRWSYAMVAAVAIVSLLPMVAVYEHWLVPDSLLVGLTLLALAFASRRVDARWYPWTMIAICVMITCTKEVGFGVVVLAALVMVLRRSYRVAGAAVLISTLLFVTVVLPSSSREGRVVWHQPLDTQLTMERFRVIVAGVYWSDLSPELAEVKQQAAECGMTPTQLIAETFHLTDRVVTFADCPELWGVVDNVSQFDILEAHVRNPDRVANSIERGFVPDMYAMANWGDFPLAQRSLMDVDRIPAGAVALLPFAALAAALVLRRGRRFALIAILASGMALVAALLDPSSQDRHTLVFRIAAFALGLLALTEATTAAGADGETRDVERPITDDAHRRLVST